MNKCAASCTIGSPIAHLTEGEFAPRPTVGRSSSPPLTSALFRLSVSAHTRWLFLAAFVPHRRSDGVLGFVGRLRGAVRAALPRRPQRHPLCDEVPAQRGEARPQGHRRPRVLEVQDRSSSGCKEDGEAQQYLFCSHDSWT